MTVAAVDRLVHHAASPERNVEGRRRIAPMHAAATGDPAVSLEAVAP